MHKHMTAAIENRDKYVIKKPKTGQMGVPGKLWFISGTHRQKLGPSQNPGWLVTLVKSVLLLTIGQQIWKASIKFDRFEMCQRWRHWSKNLPQDPTKSAVWWTQYLWDMFAGVEDVDLFDGQLASRFHVVTQKHLTKSTDAQNTTFLPVCRCHGHYRRQWTVSVDQNTLPQTPVWYSMVL